MGLRDHLKDEQRKNKDLQTRLTAAEAKVQELKEELKKLTPGQNDDALRQQVEKQRQKIVELEVEIQALKEKVKQYEKEKRYLEAWKTRMQAKEEELTQRERELQNMKEEIDNLKALLKAVKLVQGSHAVSHVFKLYEKMKTDYDAKAKKFDVEKIRFKNERKQLRGWFHSRQWTLKVGGRAGTTLTHQTSKTKFEDLSERHAFLEELVRRLKSEEFNMDTQIKDLERLVRKYVQTKRDLEKRERELKKDHKREEQKLKNMRKKIKEMQLQ